MDGAIRPSICCLFRDLCFLLVTLAGRFLDFPIAIFDLYLFSLLPLSLGRTFGVDKPGFAIGAIVNFGNLSCDVIAFDVLPSLTAFAKDCVSIVIIEITDALDGILLIVLSEDGRRVLVV